TMNSGMFSTSRKKESEKVGAVSWDSRIEVPEMPLSYRFTGARKTVTPKALMHPAMVRKTMFVSRSCEQKRRSARTDRFKMVAPLLYLEPVSNSYRIILTKQRGESPPFFMKKP